MKIPGLCLWQEGWAGTGGFQERRRGKRAGGRSEGGDEVAG